MNLPSWLLLDKEKCSTGHLQGRAIPDAPLQVRNLTRQTVLASNVDIANTGAQRRRGLLHYKELPSGKGLWITPCEAVHTMGMRFPIDLIYLDQKLRVKKVRCRVLPWRLSACLSAHSVLELPSGTIQNTDTKPGDRLEVLPSFLLNK